MVVVSCSRGVGVLPFYDDSFFGFCVPFPRMWAVDSSLCCVIRWFLFRADAPFLCF